MSDKPDWADDEANRLSGLWGRVVMENNGECLVEPIALALRKAHAAGYRAGQERAFAHVHEVTGMIICNLPFEEPPT